MYKISSTKLIGEISVPYSKSTLHRSIVIAILNRDISTIFNLNYCDDVLTTLKIAKQIGCKIKKLDNYLIIDSTSLCYDQQVLDCGESGTTLRFMSLIILFLFKEVNLTGSTKLLSRPFDGYDQLFKKNNIKCRKDNGTLMIKGEIKNIEVKLNNQKSSQFVSAILLISPYFNSTKLKLFSENNSIGYIDLTIAIIKQLGVNITRNHLDIFTCQGDYNFQTFYNEVDESAYPYFYTLKVLGHDINIKNENKFSFQPDKVFKQIKDLELIDINGCPDILPILVVYKILIGDSAKFININRARYKEANRVEEMLMQLIDNGYDIKINDNAVIIGLNHRVSELRLRSVNDHRIAMSFIILSTSIRHLYLDDINCISKSYPTFIADFLSLGGVIENCEN